MWNCASCGAEVDDNYAACWSCGTHVDGEPAPRLVRDDSRVRCYVCDALGEFAEIDGVCVCPGCIDGTTPDPPARKWYLRSRISVGHIGRFPLFIEPAFILLAVMLLLDWRHWMVLPILVASVLWHELGHALTGRAICNVGGSVTLSPWGGYYFPDAPILEATDWPRRRASLLVIAGGPAATLLLAGLCVVLARLLGSRELLVAGYMNVFLALANLLPIPPLDGGQMLMSAVGNSHEFRARLYFWYAVAIGVGWFGMMVFLFSGGISADNQDDLWWDLLAPFMQVLPYLGLYCLVAAAETPAPDRWKLARLAREQKREGIGT
jgi:Zn-dependent protease